MNRDHLVYINLATDRQQRAYSFVRELHRLTVLRLQRRNAPIMAALLASPPFAVGGWAWVDNPASTIRQGVKKGIDATVPKTKLSLNWNGPFRILSVGPTAASGTPGNRLRQDKLLFLDLPSDLPGRDDASPATTSTTPETYQSSYPRTSQHTSSQLPLLSPPPLDNVAPPPERLEVE